MNENIQGKSCKVKVVPHIEFTPEQKFEFLLHNIINHKFLNYHQREDICLQNLRLSYL